MVEFLVIWAACGLIALVGAILCFMLRHRVITLDVLILALLAAATGPIGVVCVVALVGCVFGDTVLFDFRKKEGCDVG